uniref:Uncharacterized protein n=1 Tax=viral metagenome TaxID=1070528 RepID=A0A6C0EPG4_9ZZZZ
MIPYVIEHSNTSDDIKECNIDTSYYSSEKDKLNENIINNIIEIMYEFCSEEYGYGIKISSYDDFCYQYWKIREIKMANFYLFYIKYFENGWKIWNVEDYKEDIYISYISKFGI